MIAEAEYIEDNGDDATPVRAQVDGTPTAKLPDVAIVRAMTSAAAPPPSVRPTAVVPPPASARVDSSMVPPPSVQAQQTTEIPQVASVPRDMLHSAPPTSMSQPPPAPLPAKGGGTSKFLVAAAAVLVLAVGGLAAKQAGVAGFGAKDGALLASVAGPGGASIDKFELFVDGSKRCEASPCKVDGLSEGEHFLKVMAPGYETTAAISINVKGGSTTDQRVDLVPSKDGAKAEADSPAEKPKEESLSLDDLGKKKPAEDTKSDEEKSASSAAASKAPSSGKTAAKDAPAKDKEEAKDSSASDKGMINISSSPPVNVVVDGKPIGMTPKTVRVAAGSHTIVFIGAEGRQVRSVNVKGGGSASVAVTF